MCNTENKWFVLDWDISKSFYENQGSTRNNASLISS